MDSAVPAARLLNSIPNPSSSSSFFSTRCRPWRRPLSFALRCFQTPNPAPAPPPNLGSLLACSTVSAQEAPADLPGLRLCCLVDEFRFLPEPINRVKRLLAYASVLRPFPEAARVSSNRVMGCTAQVWVTAELDDLGRMRFAADSDSEITRANSRVNTWRNVLISMQKRTKALIAEGEGRPPIEPFPLLVIDVDWTGFRRRGAMPRLRSWMKKCQLTC